MMVKKLYRVKSISSGRISARLSSLEDKDKDKIEKAPYGYLSKLWDKLDADRMARVMKSLRAWKQIDKRDIANLLSALLNRRKLNITMK